MSDIMFGHVKHHTESFTQILQYQEKTVHINTLISTGILKGQGGPLMLHTFGVQIFVLF